MPVQPQPTRTMIALNSIGLDQQKSTELAEGLNHLLADLQLQYQNLRAVHWNIRGEKFFELHQKFDELYNSAQETADLVAERILTLGAVPMHTFTDYVEASGIVEAKDVSAPRGAVEAIVNGYTALLVRERSLLAAAAELSDEGTVSLISDLITEQEKTVWMLSAWLSD